MEDLTYTRAQNSSSVSPRKLAPSNPLEPRLVRGLFHLYCGERVPSTSG